MRGFFTPFRMTSENRQRRRFWLRQNDDLEVLRQPPHLSDDKAVAKMGHPARMTTGWVCGSWDLFFGARVGENDSGPGWKNRDGEVMD
jgi:hypothetical protein